MNKIKKFFSIGISSFFFFMVVILLIFGMILQSVTAIVGGYKSSTDGVTYITMDNMPPWVTPEIILTALDIQDKYGIYASVTIAQAHQEVGGTWDGTTLYATAAQDHNLFGFKATDGGLSEWNGEITWDGTRGLTGTYRHYDSFTQGLKDRARLLLTGDAYSAVAATANGRTGSAEQLTALSESPWCEDQYSTLQAIMDAYNLTRLDTMTAESYRTGFGGGGLLDGADYSGADFIYYNQSDPRWGSLPLVRGATISSSGCAATALAMIWATYNKDPSITPATIFDVGNANGALVDGWLSRDGCVLATNMNAQYGCTAEHTMDWFKAMDALNNGGAVMVVGKGDAPFTKEGHWIVIIGYDGDNAYLADPGHKSCTWAAIGGSSSGVSLSSIELKAQDMIIFRPR